MDMGGHGLSPKRVDREAAALERIKGRREERAKMSMG